VAKHWVRDVGLLEALDVVVGKREFFGGEGIGQVTEFRGCGVRKFNSDLLTA
jgi:hypothetical protein